MEKLRILDVPIVFDDLKPVRREITHARLLQLLRYEAGTGEFTWRVTKNSAQAGAIAGRYTQSFGYRVVKLDGRTYLAHRLAWFYVHGHWPNLVDHINGDPADNRLVNLRDVDHSMNMQNRRPNKRSSSGLLGVSKQAKGWRAAIRVNGVTQYLGYFRDAEEAYAVYVAAKRRVHPGCTI